MCFPYPSDEAKRLAVLHRLQLLDTPPSPAFDRLCSMARQLFDVPIALITLLDEHRQWFKAAEGTALRETPRELAFCNYTILHDEVMVVPDARTDARFASHPAVSGEPFVRFYAGAPLIIGPGLRAGSLCIVDTKPRDLNPAAMRQLAFLGRSATDEIWLHYLQNVALGSEALDGFMPVHGSVRALEPDAFELPVTGAQVRGARGLLNWSVRELSEASGVSPMTIKRIEAEGDAVRGRNSSIAAVREALERSGIRFIRSNGKPAVQLG